MDQLLIVGGGTGGWHCPIVTHHLLQQLLQHPLSQLLLHQQQKQLLPNILVLVPQREFGDGVQIVFLAVAADTAGGGRGRSLLGFTSLFRIVM